MPQAKLILSLPHDYITATSLMADDFGRHRSPGSGKYFEGRSILVDLPVRDEKQAFQFLDEGGWRDANADAARALHLATKDGKRTKTALSNSAFSCTPISAWERVYLAKTGGELLEMAGGAQIATFPVGECTEEMTPDQIAKAIGQPVPAKRVPRLYMTFAPIEMLMLTNLTPTEYVWYATHRPGKVFRAVAFSEVREDPGLHLVAVTMFEAAKLDLIEHSGKKTKTVIFGDTFNKVPFTGWIGYDREAAGGIYVGDRNSARLWSFPERIPRPWERAY